MCYYGAWAVYRAPPMTFNSSNVDPFSCTHLIYSFAGLHKTKFVIQSLDPKHDIEQGIDKRVQLVLNIKTLVTKIMYSLSNLFVKSYIRH